MLQIVENTLKEGKESEYISVAKQFTNERYLLLQIGIRMMKVRKWNYFLNINQK